MMVIIFKMTDPSWC